MNEYFRNGTNSTSWLAPLNAFRDLYIDLCNINTKRRSTVAILDSHDSRPLFFFIVQSAIGKYRLVTPGLGYHFDATSGPTVSSPSGPQSTNILTECGHGRTRSLHSQDMRRYQVNKNYSSRPSSTTIRSILNLAESPMEHDNRLQTRVSERSRPFLWTPLGRTHVETPLKRQSWK